MTFTQRPLNTWTINELANYNQAKILMAIPNGEFNQAVFAAVTLSLHWHSERMPPQAIKKNQARAVKNAIAALTNHCESDPACLKALKALELNFKDFL